jgi:peptidoglycan/LPS O-acetylase OafA/YrhL
MAAKEEIKAITGLRGVGAVWVFLYHLFLAESFPVLNQGMLGVPLFFVLSGFILFFVHDQDFCNLPNCKSIKNFFALRIARIYPLHLFTLSLLLMLVNTLPGFIEHYNDQKFSLPNLFATSLLVQTWGIGHIPYFKDASSAWNVPAWSLSAEMAYYFTFPWLAYLISKVKHRGLSVFLGIVIATLAVTVYGLLLGNENETYTRSLICGWFAFMFGMSLYNLSKFELQLPTWIIELCGTTLIVLKISIPEVNTGLFVLGVGAWIFAFLRKDSYLSRLFSWSLIYWAGKISFSLYIIHWPLVQLLNYLDYHLHLSGPTWHYATHITAIPLTMLLAYLTYLKIELPARKTLRTYLLSH